MYLTCLIFLKDLNRTILSNIISVKGRAIFKELSCVIASLNEWSIKKKCIYDEASFKKNSYLENLQRKNQLFVKEFNF